MSAPDTNIHKQEKRHSPALIGILIAAGFGLLMLLLMLFGAFSEEATNEISEPAAQSAPAQETTPTPETAPEVEGGTTILPENTAD
ncbi:hypothetical protein [Poseidonocella sedimentorum]|uniref:Uncharacterized protein n=1 Tax=Poseidonocella sedimentorum TaxID=871652 RepID=A0A1I6EQS9_9RHOB|nr:hypothetical protein [Poseidonocella sedimentorum]SFR19921.1 hypothetical protein SAMN04515673_11825 [Poseidonocella sedimentorum]